MTAIMQIYSSQLSGNAQHIYNLSKNPEAHIRKLAIFKFDLNNPSHTKRLAEIFYHDSDREVKWCVAIRFLETHDPHLHTLAQAYITSHRTLLLCEGTGSEEEIGIVTNLIKSRLPEASMRIESAKFLAAYCKYPTVEKRLKEMHTYDYEFLVKRAAAPKSDQSTQPSIKDLQSITTVILAGGQSSRFKESVEARMQAGQNQTTETCKIIATLDGTPIIGHVISSLPTAKIILVTPGKSNPAWDEKIRQSIIGANEEAGQSLYGGYVSFLERDERAWMESLYLAMEKSRALGSKYILLIMGDSFIDINLRRALQTAINSRYENVIVYSTKGSGSHILGQETGKQENAIGAISRYEAIESSSPEGASEIFYLLSVSETENIKKAGGLDAFFCELLQRQYLEPECSLLGGIPVSLSHDEVNLNTVDGLDALNQQVFGFPHSWWGKFSQHGESFSKELGREISPLLEQKLGLPAGQVSAVQVNIKAAVYRWQSPASSAYIKIFSDAEGGELRFLNNKLAHDMFPDLFPSLFFHGYIQGHMVQMEEDISSPERTSFDRFLLAMDFAGFRQMLSGNNFSPRLNTLYELIHQFRQFPVEQKLARGRYPALKDHPLTFARFGQKSFFPYPHPEVPFGAEFIDIFLNNVRQAFSRAKGKRYEVNSFYDQLKEITQRVLAKREKTESLIMAEETHYHCHGDMMPFNLFLPNRVIDGEYFHLSPFSYELATLAAGLVGTYTAAEPRERHLAVLTGSYKFVEQFISFENKTGTGPATLNSFDDFSKNSGFLPFLVLKLMHEVYAHYFLFGHQQPETIKNYIKPFLNLAEEVSRTM